MKKYIYRLLMVVQLVIAAGCSNDQSNSLFYSETEQTILNYMEGKRDTYSAFLELIYKSGYDKAFSTYGNYSLFAFTDNAWQQYLDKCGKGSLSDFSQAEIDELAKAHTIATGRVLSSTFKNGNLDQINLLRDNLVCRFGDGNKIYINSNQVIVRDIELLNGVLFLIDGVIEPQKKSVADIVSQEQGCTLFKEALTQTGLMAKIAHIQTTASYTVLICSDDVYTAEGIRSFDELQSKFDDEYAPNDTRSEIYQYVARHIIPSTLYQNRFKTQIYQTMGRYFLDIVIDRKFVINPDAQMPSSIDLNSGNMAAKNGVCHYLLKPLDLSVTKPKPLFYDLAEQPELIEWKLQNSGNWSVSNEQYSVESGYENIETNCTQFFYYHSPGGAYNDLSNQDGMLAKTGSWYANFSLPSMPNGNYEVWIHVIKGHNAGAAVQCYWDGLKLGRVFGVNVDGANRFIGGVPVDRWGPAGANFKFKQPIPGKYTVMAVYLGNVNIVGKHTFGIKTVIDGLLLGDVIEFIPIQQEITM